MVFFSIVIPLFNKENFIQETLKSVLNQTFLDYEIIVVNDCSIDASQDKIMELNVPNLKLIQHETNKGLSAARNTGIKNAKGNYIVFLDADDLWKTNFLSSIQQLIETFQEADIFGTDFEMIYKNGKILPNLKNISGKENQNNFIIDDYFKANLYYPIYCFSSVCFSKEVFETVGYFDEKITFGEDIDFNIRANSAYKLAYCNQPLAQYLLFSENQITNSNFEKKVVPDFDKYENLAKNNKSIQKFLDFQRYSIGINYKLLNTEKFINYTKNIDHNNLTFRQKVLLKMPVSIYKSIKKVKLFLMQKGVQLTSFK